MVRAADFIEWAAERMELTHWEALAVMKAARVLQDQDQAFWLGLRAMGRRRHTERQQLAYASPAASEMQRAAWLGQALEAQQLPNVLKGMIALVLRLEEDFANQDKPDQPVEW